MKNMIGRKIGMTQVFQEDGSVVPVTVVQAGPLVVVQKKTIEIDGYNALQVGFQEVKEQRVNKPIKGHFAKGNVGLKRYLQEFRVENVDEYEIGQEIKVDTFEIGEMIDVTGISKGKGTQGVIKRHGFATGDQTHGSHFHRNPGGLSAGTYPGRVFKGKKMGGRMGNKKITTQNLEIIKIDVEKNLILIKGAIPGPNKGLVTIKQTVKN